MAVLLAASFCLPAGAKEKTEVYKATTYMFGFATSFADSVSYITTVQKVDSVTLNRKNKFLMDRNLYSVQLQRHLDADPPTGKFVTAIYYAPNKAKLTKKWNKVLRLHSNGAEGQNLMMLQDEDFSFKMEEYVPSEMIEVESAPADKKSKKSKKGGK